jgi:hypothetical protein
MAPQRPAPFPTWQRAAFALAVLAFRLACLRAPARGH